MAECINCSEYTKFNGGLCYKCYKKEGKITQVDTAEEDFLDEEFEEIFEAVGLSDKEWNRRYNMIKGRIAETLIQELFL